MQTVEEYVVTSVSAFRRTNGNEWKVGLVFGSEAAVSWQPFKAINSFGLLKVRYKTFIG